MLQLVLRGAHDSIPNVRFTAVRALQEMAPHLEAGAVDSQVSDWVRLGGFGTTSPRNAQAAEYPPCHRHKHGGPYGGPFVLLHTRNIIYSVQGLYVALYVARSADRTHQPVCGDTREEGIPILTFGRHHMSNFTESISLLEVHFLYTFHNEKESSEVSTRSCVYRSLECCRCAHHSLPLLHPLLSRVFGGRRMICLHVR